MTIEGTPPAGPGEVTLQSPSLPTYTVGSIVYLKESAALGFLEAVKIYNITYGRSGRWIYKTIFGPQPTSGAPYFGDRILPQKSVATYFNEDEFVTKAQALQIIKAHLELRLQEIENMISET